MSRRLGKKEMGRTDRWKFRAKLTGFGRVTFAREKRAVRWGKIVSPKEGKQWEEGIGN